MVWSYIQSPRINYFWNYKICEIWNYNKVNFLTMSENLCYDGMYLGGGDIEQMAEWIEK